MIKLLTPIIALFITVFVIGCSSNANDPITPQSNNDMVIGNTIPEASMNEGNHSLLGMWTANFDIENNTVSVVPYRENNGHYNLKAWLPSPGLSINGYSDDVLDVDVTIHNPFTIDGYDVRLIIFTDSAGHGLEGQSTWGWTDLYDIPGGESINPFMTYNRNELFAKFPGPSQSMENCHIKCPAGNFIVHFAIDGSFPGNCEEPFKMWGYSNTEINSQIGSSADVEIKVKDWQNNVDHVSLECPEITGVPSIYLIKSATDYLWTGSITNNNGAPAGDYNCLIRAESGEGSLYKKVTIHVDQWVLLNGYCVHIGGTSDDKTSTVVNDSNDNVIITGSFNGTVDFDPGPGTAIETVALTSTYIAKYSKTGDFMWVKTWGGYASNSKIGISLGNADTIYLTGAFLGTVDFNPHPATTEYRTSNGSNDIYISCLSANGDLFWVKTIGADYSDMGRDIVRDESFNIYIAGDYKRTVDFDPSAGEDFHTPSDDHGNFLTKYNMNGAYQWTKTWDGRGFTAIGYHDDNVYVSGYFDEDMDFDPDPVDVITLPCQGEMDAFLIKVDSSGDFIWADSWGGIYAYTIGWDVAIDSIGDVFVAGGFMGIVDFDSSEESAMGFSFGMTDVFLTKISSDHVFQNVKTWGGTQNDNGLAVTIDNDDNVFVSGVFTGTVDFNPGTGTNNLTASDGGPDTFLVKFDALDNFEWARSFGFDGSVRGNSLSRDSEDNIFLAGEFSNVADMNPGAETEYYETYGSHDIFINKILPNGYWE